MSNADGNRAIKIILFADYGNYCWLCEKQIAKKKLTLHHIIPREFKGKTTVENGMILCEHCHFDVVNKVKYNSAQYWTLMNQALKVACRLKRRRLYKAK